MYLYLFFEIILIIRSVNKVAKFPNPNINLQIPIFTNVCTCQHFEAIFFLWSSQKTSSHLDQMKCYQAALASLVSMLHP